jgi:autotransporter-associated beta strand protein
MKHAMALLKTLALLAGALLLTSNASAATKTWAVGGVDTNWSTVLNWSPSGAPANGDDAVFGNTGATIYVANPNSAATNNVVDFAFTAKPNSLSFNQTNSSCGTLITGPGLVINGTAANPNVLYVGSGMDQLALAALDLTTIRGTSLAITNTNSVIAIQEGGVTGQASRRATLNLAGLNTFSANVQRLAIGCDNDGLALHRRPSATLYLAKTNYITCTYSGTPAVGGNSGIGYEIAEVVQQGGNACTNRLGQVNVFNMNGMKFGGSKTSNTKIDFNTGWVNPSVTFRNVAGTGRQSAWLIADDSTTSGSSGSSTAIVDFTGGTVDALLDNLYLGVGQSANNQYYAGGNATLTFNLGTIDVNTMEMGYQYGVGSSAARGTLNVNGSAVLNVNKDIRMARNLGPVSGSSLVTNSVAVMTINGGTVQVYGNIVDGGGTNLITVTNNGTLNMKPAGDAVAGNIGVRVLTLGACAFTNYGTLSVSNLNVVRPASQFTVYPGQTLGVIGPNLVGTATVNTNLILTNASVAFDLGTPGGANDQLAVLANLDLQGTNSLLINPLAGFGPGGYPVVTYGTGGGGGALSGDVTNNLKVGGAMGDSRYTTYFDTNTANTITLNVSGGPAANLSWSGDGVGNLWNLHSTFNWNNGGGANNSEFYNLDTVTFDDTGSASSPVSLVGSLLPASVTVNGTKSYTFGGSGKISGSTGLNYNSSGTLTLLATNDYAGTTTISSGTVQVGNGTTADGAIGSGQIDNAGALIFNSASYQSIPGVITGSGSIVKRGPGVTLLSGLSTFSTTVTNEAGTLVLGSGDALGETSLGAVINNGATLDLGGYGIGSEPVTVVGTGVGGAGAIVNSGSTAGSLNNLTLLGPTTFGGSSMWVIGAEPTSTGLVANSNKVTKVGSSAVEISNGSSSAITDAGWGDLEIQNGSFIFYGYVSLGDPTKTITVRNGAKLEVDCTGDSLTTKQIVMDAGSTLASALPNRLMPQYATVPGPISLGGSVTFNVVATDTINVSGEINGSGPLLKANPGLLSLSASNSFTGDLSIQSGTVALTLDGSVTKAANIVLNGTTIDASARTDGTLTLGTGQTLKGSGMVIGNLVSPATTTVTPGASIGAISVTGNATLRGTTVMEMSKSAGVYSADLLAVTNLLDLGGTLTVTYSGDRLQLGDTFTLFTAASFANSFTTVNLPVVSGVVWTNMTAIDGTIRVLSAPPPSPPTLSGGSTYTNGTYQLNFSGPSGYSYSVYASPDVTADLTNWALVGNGTFSASPVSFVDLNAPLYNARFYRISIP